MNTKLKILLVMGGLVLFGTLAYGFIFIFLDEDHGVPVRIAYFHGGRTMLIYRAYIADYFEQEKVNVTLLTKEEIYADEYRPVPKTYEEIIYLPNYGKVKGTGLVEEVVSKGAEAATIGESSFIMAVEQNLPIVAVAEMGYDIKGNAGHGILFRKSANVRNASDIKGKTLVSRRSSGGDTIMLMEFLLAEGLDPEKDVIIQEDVYEDELKRGHKNDTIDGGYYHLMAIIPLVRSGEWELYRRLDWVNPEISQSVLIFHKDFVLEHPKEVEKTVEAFMKRIRDEHDLPTEARRREKGRFEQKGLEMETDFMGMNYPQYNDPPLVREDLLYDAQDLLIKHHYVSKWSNLSPFIDNSFVEKAYKDMEGYP